MKRRGNSAPIATVGNYDIVQSRVRQALIEAALIAEALLRPGLASERLIVARVATLTLVVVVLAEVRIASLALAMVRATVASDAVPESLSRRRHLPGIGRARLLGLSLLRCVLKLLLLRGLLGLKRLLSSRDLDWQSGAAIDQCAWGELAGDRADRRSDPGSGLIRDLTGKKPGTLHSRVRRNLPDAAGQLNRWTGGLSGNRLGSGERVEHVTRLLGSGEELVLSRRL